MRKTILICAAMLCLAGATAAQNDPAASPVASPAPSGSNRGFSSDVGNPWQVGMNFTYQRFDMGHDNSNLYGIQSTVARFIGDGMFAAEGTVTVNFGYIVPGDREHFTFYGGGLRVQKRGGKFQPWAHVLAGGTHIRLNQFIGPASFNGFGLMAGGGVDIQWKSHISWRVEADFLPTHVSGAWQKTISTGGGIVISF